MYYLICILLLTYNSCHLDKNVYFDYNNYSKENNALVYSIVDSLSLADSTVFFEQLLKKERKLLKISKIIGTHTIVGVVESSSFSAIDLLGFVYDVQTKNALFINVEFLNSQYKVQNQSMIFVLNKSFDLIHSYDCINSTIDYGHLYNFDDECQFSVIPFNIKPIHLHDINLSNLISTENLNLEKHEPSRNNLYSIPPIIGKCRK